VVANSTLVRKIYFPREVFPLTAVATKIVEFAISCLILAGLMLWYQMAPTVQILWAPVIILYTLVVALTIAFFGAAINVYYRDVGAALPLMLSLVMYASPVIYPLTLVKETLLVRRAAGEWSDFLYALYTANPLAGIIDAFQSVVLRGTPPDLWATLPGAIATFILFPLSYHFFKRTESGFADVI
jgi:lipopolysaccharide transport system permease protein